MENKKTNRKEEKGKKKHGLLLRVVLIVFAVLLVAAVSVYAYILKNYKLNQVQVTGNLHYTEDEIKEMFDEQIKKGNTVFFYLDNRFHPVTDVPFIDKFDVEIIDNNTVTITVYEKSMAGCVLYMDQYVYFDDSGKVLETSPERLEDVPCIDGLKFDSIVVGEKLPINDEELFQDILTMTQLIDKNSLTIDRIRYDSNNNIILYKDDIKIIIGDDEKLEDKLMNLGNILDEIQGKSGVLDLSNYENSNGNVIFKEN
jgi:cell division septal protein FtsQ